MVSTDCWMIIDFLRSSILNVKFMLTVFSYPPSLSSSINSIHQWCIPLMPPTLRICWDWVPVPNEGRLWLADFFLESLCWIFFQFFCSFGWKILRWRLLHCCQGMFLHSSIGQPRNLKESFLSITYNHPFFGLNFAKILSN